MTTTTPTHETKFCVGPVSQQAGKASTCEGGTERKNILQIGETKYLICSQLTHTSINFKLTLRSNYICKTKI